ncbi:MAG: hypothetical protein AAF224_05145 [Pseudomonadota bacterium]
MKPSVLVIIIVVFSMAFVSRAIGTVGDVRMQLAAADTHADDGHKEMADKAPHDADHGDKHADGHDAKENHASHSDQKSSDDKHHDDGHGTPGGAVAPMNAAASLQIPPRKEPGDFVGLAELIKERSAEIERRIAELDEREQVLMAAEVRINEKLVELEAARASLAEKAARVDAASGEDIKALASMYANMKPQQAGQIFNAMEPTFAAGFLTAIRSEAAAAILASMDPQKAYAVSVIIAGRNVQN